MAPILLVSHEEDGDWTFWDDSDFSEENAMVVGLGNITKHDPSLLALSKLPYGWHAWRETASSPWTYGKNDE